MKERAGQGVNAWMVSEIGSEVSSNNDWQLDKGNKIKINCLLSTYATWFTHSRASCNPISPLMSTYNQPAAHFHQRPLVHPAGGVSDLLF